MLKRFAAIILVILPFICFAEEFTAPKDFEIINAGEPGVTAGKVKVIEFFSYGCPWCYRIEPALEKWVQQQNNKIEFSRIPVVFHKDWIYYAKAYYAANLLHLEDKLTPILFKAIQSHKDYLTNNDSMVDFFVAQGVEKPIAQSAFEHSTIIDMQVTQGLELMTKFRVNGVPAIVIANRYKTDLQLAGNEERFFKIINFLVDKALAEQKA